MFKRLFLTAFTAFALIYPASAVNASPAISGGMSFYVSSSLSDSTGQPHTPTIYNIEGRTYFKLRDLAKLVDFGVVYDPRAKSVRIDPDDSYVPEPTESSTIINTATAPASAIPSKQTFYLADKPISLDVYNIKNNNFVGLRSIASLVDFGVSYNTDNKRITVYSKYPYADELAWNAAMNDFTGNLRASSPASYHLISARYAPIITPNSTTDWRMLISTLRSATNAPICADADSLYRANLYWADTLAAALTNSGETAATRFPSSLVQLADANLFDNPDKAALQADFKNMSSAYLSVHSSALSQVSPANGYAKNAYARLSLPDQFTLVEGASAADVASAKAYFSSNMSELSSLKSDDERLAYIYRLLKKEYRIGGNASWVNGYGQSSPVSSRSLAAAADWMFSEAGIPSFLAQSWSAAWNIIYINGQWAVFDFSKGESLQSLDAYCLIDTHPGSTVFMTQVMRPGSAYYNVTRATVDHYFTYTDLSGAPQATAAQMQAYIKKVNPNVAQSVLDMIPYYLSEGQAEGIRGDIAFAQSCLETGNFTFKGSAVSLENNNFCGLGVLDNGMQGAIFDTPQLGIRAQIQHLKAYANKQPLKNPCIDPRFTLVTRGASPTVQYLGMQENPQGYGWAAGADYGVKILNILENILTY